MNFHSIYSIADDFTSNYTVPSQSNTIPSDETEVIDVIENEIMSKSIDKNTILNEVQSLKEKFDQSEMENRKIIKNFAHEIKGLKIELKKFKKKPQEPLRFNLLPELPFTSLLKYREFEEKLSKDHELRMQLRHFIKRVDAIDFRTFVKKAVKAIIPDELAIHYSWRGTNCKPSVQTFKLIAIIKDICHSRFINSSETEVNRILQQHFLHANDRFSRKNKTST